MLWLCKACRERTAASGDTAKRRKKNKSLIPETHTNKSGFVQTGLGPQQRPAWENKEQHQTVGRLVIMPLFLFEHVFVFFHFEIMEYNICADQFSKSAGNGSTAPAQFDSWIQAKSSDAPEWYNLKIGPCGTACFAYPSLTRQKKKCGGKTASTTSAHLRVTKEVVELDPAGGGVSLEVGEHVSKQKPRHGRSLSAAQTAWGWREKSTWDVRLKKQRPREETRNWAEQVKLRQRILQSETSYGMLDLLLYVQVYSK